MWPYAEPRRTHLFARPGLFKKSCLSNDIKVLPKSAPGKSHVPSKLIVQKSLSQDTAIAAPAPNTLYVLPSILIHAIEEVTGYSKKKCQLSCSFVICWSLLLFYSDMVHKQRLKV